MGLQVCKYIGAFHICIKGHNSCEPGIRVIRIRLHGHLRTCIFPVQVLHVPQLVIRIASHAAVKDSVYPDIRLLVHTGRDILVAASHLSCQYGR